MKTHLKQIKELRSCLRWALRQAQWSRGALVGNPDPAPLKDYDSRLARCRKALK